MYNFLNWGMHLTQVHTTYCGLGRRPRIEMRVTASAKDGRVGFLSVTIGAQDRPSMLAEPDGLAAIVVAANSWQVAMVLNRSSNSIGVLGNSPLWAKILHIVVVT